MLNYMLIWDFWLAKSRVGRAEATTFYSGHTETEQEAFDRLMAKSK
jgi:hypothetical protein